MSRATCPPEVGDRKSTDAVEGKERPERRGHTGLLLLLVWAIGFGLSITAHITADEWAIQSRREHFRRLANEEIHEIQTRILTALESVRAVRGLFYASHDVERTEFRAFVESLEMAESVQALAWVPRVSNDLRPEYEKAGQKSGFPSFKFTERNSEGAMVESDDREEYYPVFYLEPYLDNEEALGFDLGSNPTRLAGLRSARDSGREVATARVTLVQGSTEQFGFLICLPIYREGSIPKSIEMRKSDLVGFAVGTFRIGSLISSALFEGESTHSPIRIHVFDKTAPSGAQLLYPRNSSIENSNDLEATFRQEATLHFAFRDWLIVATPTRDSVFTLGSFIPWLVLSFGLLVTTLMAMWIGAIICRNDYADQLMAVRTAELLETNGERERTQQRHLKPAETLKLQGQST